MTINNEFHYTERDFQRVQRVVYDFAGINLTEGKKNLVYNRLAKRIRFLEFNSFEQYLNHVEAVGEEEFVHLINAITTNLTFFFRENHHFEFLAQQALPELMKKNHASKKIRIWSAGCSVGMEPYSIAITVKEVMPPGWDVKILATDLDSQVLAEGQRGVYKLEHLKGMDEKRIKRWFKRGTGANEGMVKIIPEAADIIEFKQLNLMQDWPLKESMDIIFCRNVVIYFDKPTQRKLFARYAKQLHSQGYLIIGHSESLYEVSDEFNLLGRTIYQKKT